MAAANRAFVPLGAVFPPSVFLVRAYRIIPFDTTIRITSLMSIWIIEFITVGVIVTIPWNRKVPIITFVILALFTLAPPMRIADTAGSAI